MTTTTILPTRNEAWGFFGTMDQVRGQFGTDPAQAWRLASEALAAAIRASAEGIRAFLDSRHGRHFADGKPANATGPRERANANGLASGATLDAAVAAATDRWMGWQIGRRTSRETGIPAGLPYLTGFVTHFEILAETGAEA